MVAYGQWQLTIAKSVLRNMQFIQDYHESNWQSLSRVLSIDTSGPLLYSGPLHHSFIDPGGLWVECSMGDVVDPIIRDEVKNRLLVQIPENRQDYLIDLDIDFPLGACGYFKMTFTCPSFGVMIAKFPLVIGGCDLDGTVDLPVEAECRGATNCSEICERCLNRIDFDFPLPPVLSLYTPVLSVIRGIGFPVCLKIISTFCFRRVTGQIGRCEWPECPPRPPLPERLLPPVYEGDFSR